MFEEEAVTSGAVCVWRTGGDVGTSLSHHSPSCDPQYAFRRSRVCLALGGLQGREEKTVIFTETTLHMKQEEDVNAWLQTWTNGSSRGAVTPLSLHS